MGLSGLLRLAALAAIGLALLLGSGCAANRSQVPDQTAFEEWGRCNRVPPVRFTGLCLQLHRPL